MKLYYLLAACSHAPNIALREAGLDFQLVSFDKKTGLLQDGRPITDVNEKGYVPVLELDDGTRYTEVAAILQWIADHSKVPLAPPNRYRLQEWLHFIGMEIHKIYWPLFHDGADIENEKARAKLAKSFAWTEKQLGASPYLFGEQFTVADAYLVTVLNWARAGGIDLDAWPGLASYRSRVRERPAVIAALESEGLLKRK